MKRSAFTRSSKIVAGKMRYYFGADEVTAKQWDAYWAKHKPAARGAPRVFIRADFSAKNGGKGERAPALAVNIFDQSPDCHFRNYRECEAKVTARGLHYE